MQTYESLKHTTWECKYHVVFIPKCRRKVLYQGIRQELGGGVPRFGGAVGVYTTRGLDCYLSFWEQLEIPSEQRGEGRRVLVMGQGGGFEDGGFHRREVLMILGVQTLLLHPAPIAFDQVEVGRVGGQKLQVDAQSPGVGLHQRAPLVAGVVQKEGERNVPGAIEGGQLAEQRTDTLGRDIRFVGEEVNLPTDRIQRPQHVEALPP